MNIEITKNKYPDGTFYPVVTGYDNNTTNQLTFRINSYEDLWFLKQIKDVLDNQKIKCNLTIPCLLDAQADRRFNSNESHNLKLVCEFINQMKLENVEIFHPHNQEVVEALIDNVNIIDNTFFIKQVLSEIYCKDQLIQRDKGLFYHQKEELSKNLILMSTDAGGFKPLMKLANMLDWQGETFSASKSRKWQDDESKLVQQIDREDFEGKNILIIDDLSVYGGTFIGLAKLLKERNCGKLYLAVSHLTVSNPNIELFKYFDKVFTTDSKGLQYGTYTDKNELRLFDNLEIINLFNT